MFPEGEIAELLSFPRIFEFTELRLVAAYLSAGMKVFDIGANIGLYSILAQGLVGSSGQIWAFEPSFNTYEKLLRNLELNNCLSVHPVQLALSDEPETRGSLRADAGYGDMYRYLASAATDGVDPQGELVPVTTLDEHVKRAGLPCPDFIKVDVEGGEYRVFLGAREVLSGNPNMLVMFESEPDWCERSRCRQQDAFGVLRDLGFELYAWNGRGGTWDSQDRKLLNSRTVWACRDRSRLPTL
jgi:FkbM family methyltransferase